MALQYDMRKSTSSDQMHTTCHNIVISCDEIEDGLYLSNRTTAKTIIESKRLVISKVITVDVSPLNLDIDIITVEHGKIQYLHICANDTPDDNLLCHFDNCYDFITKENCEGACLVHCLDGTSRGATIIAAFLMKKYSLSYQTAVDRVRAKRPCIWPNPGFIWQLKLYDEMGWRLNRENINYRSFLLKCIVKKVLSDQSRMGELLAEYWRDASDTVSERVYKCKKCRKVLFSTSNLQLHSYTGTCCNKSEIQRTRMVETEKACSMVSYFIEPLPWMCPQLQNICGRFVCCHCKAKLGSYSWSGFTCNCGAEVRPAFQITKSRVDEVARR